MGVRVVSIILAAIVVVAFVFDYQVGSPTYETTTVEQDPALVEKIDELYDALRCERTSEFPTPDGAERTIVIYVCHNDSPEVTK